MSKPDLDAIQARADAASPGPWKADSEVRGDCVVWGPNGKFLMNQQAAPHWVDAPGDQKRAVSFDVDKRDGEFIAHARTDVPALLAYARDLEARIATAKSDALREAAERFKTRSDTYHKTMQEMAESREYSVEDIVRYGAYSAEANTTATWLRTRAALTATEGQA